MNKVAIAFSTKDRVELSKRSIEPLLRQPFDLFWSDGSTTEANELLPFGYGIPPHGFIHSNVRGGPDSAIVFNLTTMLNHPNEYTHLGLVENDVLLDKDWYAPTIELFARGQADGLNVGAVSARCYEDRILLQRDGYAVMHNLGAGMIILTRRAAELVLDNFRTGWTLENRRLFAQLTEIDIGTYWAFGASQHWLCADWGFDKILNLFGYASLALTPCKVEMIGQVPPLAEQGLKLAKGDWLISPDALEVFARYKDRLLQRREGKVDFLAAPFQLADQGHWTIFPHQVQHLDGKYSGDWRLKWTQGYGPFTWEAAAEIGEAPELIVPVSGPCTFMVSGGEKGGKILLEDLASGYKLEPMLPPEGGATQVLNCVLPAGVSYRMVRLTMLTPGTRFYGLATSEPQPMRTDVGFDYSILPPPA